MKKFREYLIEVAKKKEISMECPECDIGGPTHLQREHDDEDNLTVTRVCDNCGDEKDITDALYPKKPVKATPAVKAAPKKTTVKKSK